MSRIFLLHGDQDVTSAAAVGALLRGGVVTRAPFSQVRPGMRLGPKDRLVLFLSDRDRHAAEPAIALAAARPWATALVLVDDASFPWNLAESKLCLALEGDRLSVAARLNEALREMTPPVEPRHASAASTRATRRPTPPSARRNAGWTAGFIASSSALGALAAVALGVAVPTDFIASPALAGSEANVEAVAERAGQIGASAAFGSITELQVDQAFVPSAMASGEIAHLRDIIAGVDGAFQSSQEWSDGAILRLARLSGGALVHERTAPIGAPVITAEPMAHAVDRLADVLGPEAAAAQP